MSDEKYEDATEKHVHLEDKGIFQDVALPVLQELKPVAEGVAASLATHKILHGRKPAPPQDESKKG